MRPFTSASRHEPHPIRRHIGTRLLVLLAVPLVLLMTLFSVLDERRSRALVQAELVREGRAMARTLELTVEDYLRDRQVADVHKLVEELTGYERVLGVRLYGPDGSLAYQSAVLHDGPPVLAAEVAGVLRTRQPREIERRVDGVPAVAFLRPLVGAHGRLFGALEILQLESFIEERARMARNSLAALTLVIVVAMGVIVYLVTRLNVTRPIEELVDSIRAVGRGALPARVPVRRADELGYLAREFNAMSERLETSQHSLVAEQGRRREIEARLQQAERLAGLGQLAAGLAHEIGTPLGIIGGRAEALRRKLPAGDPGERSLRIIVAQIDRIERIVRGALDFARMREPRFAPTNLPALVHRALELIEPRLEKSGVVVALEVQDGLPDVPADADLLYQVFLNLAVNAVDAMPRGGRLHVALERRNLRHPERGGPEEPCVAVRFADTGGGIPADERERVFNPFFTTKEPGHGTGLGLSISYGIVREHGGWFDLESQVGQGTRVTVVLPLRSAVAAAPEAKDRVA